jgi:tetratricopeptide (TPR) repeat protein
LALRIVAARAAARPHLPLVALVAELRDSRGRLDALDAGGATSARAVFSWSLRVLPVPAVRMFRLLGLHPGRDVTVPAAAALAGVAVPRARAALTALARAHLLGEHAPGRYGCHDLLRAYAAEQVRSRHCAADRRDATRRLYDHYLHGAHAAARTLGSPRDFGPVPPPPPGVAPTRFADPAAAWAWLESEHRNLALVAQAAVTGAPLHACRLAWMLVDFLDRRGYWHEYDALARTALEAAGRHGDAEWQAHAHRVMGCAHRLFGRYREAWESFQRAADLYGGTGNRVGQAHAYRMMGVVTGLRGRYHEALDEAERALTLYRAAGHPGGRADVLNDIGWYRAHLGDAAAALRYCRSALDSHLELGNRHGTADAWDSLGYAHDRLGQQGPARDCYRHALALYRQLGDRHFEANTLVRLGDSRHTHGDVPAARAAWHEALVILDALRHPDAAALRRRLTPLGVVGRPVTPAR